MNCQSCGEKLTTKEMNSIQLRKEESLFPERVKFLCWYCQLEADELQDYANEEMDSFSDADPGL